MGKVRKNPVTGTIRVPVGKSYNVSTGQPKPANGCAIVALAMLGGTFAAAISTAYGVWSLIS